ISQNLRLCRSKEKENRDRPLSGPGEVVMVLGSIAGVAVLYELVQSAHQHELTTRFQSPTNVWVAAGALFIVGWLLTFAVPRVIGWFSLFVMIGGFAACSVAAAN